MGSFGGTSLGHSPGTRKDDLSSRHVCRATERKSYLRIVELRSCDFCASTSLPSSSPSCSGKRPVLCRDLTDSYHRDPHGHLWGNDQMIAHVERYWCPTLTSDQVIAETMFHA
jgi:hypothetical protein